MQTKASVAKLGLVMAVAVTLTVAQRAGVFVRLGEPRLLADAIVAMGARGYFAFIVAYMVLQPFGVPGTIFIVAAPLLWPWPTAFALSMVGTMAASVVGFAFARFVARDWVAARIPPRFRAYDHALAARGFATVALLRLVFWMPQVLHAFLGVSRVPFWTHFWGSLLGYAPPLLAVSFFGSAIFDASGHLQPNGGPLLATLGAASLVLAWGARRLERRLRARAEQGRSENVAESSTNV
jgi:uncharacterized membrane protein YdjX (TVP38/TMEM64 family)